MGEMCS